MDFELNRLWALLPDLAVLATALGVLALEMVPALRRHRKLAPLVALAGLMGSVLLLSLPMVRLAADPFPGMILNDPMAQVSKYLLLLVGLMAAASSVDAAPALGLQRSEYWGLILLATVGMMGLVSSGHLMATFITLELFSLAMYVLAGFNRRDRLCQEAALKYFVPGAFAGAFFLFGSALLLFLARDASYDALARVWHSGLSVKGTMLFAGGLAMIVVAFAFKAGLVPFHAWVPDTYQGAPTPVTAFLSAAAKVAAIVAMIRLLTPLLAALPDRPIGAMAGGLPVALAIMAGLTMTVANLVALRQDNLKRLLAWSSIAHSGYAMLGVVTATPQGASSALMYTLAYALMNFTAFGLVLALEQSLNRRQACLADLDGLGFAIPLFGVAMAVAAFSLAGLPPTFGFTAKFALFKAAVDGGHTALVVVAVVNSVLAAGYYLKLLAHLYLKPAPPSAVKPALGGIPAFVVVMAAALLIYWGLFPAAPMALTSLGANAPLP